MNLKALKGSNLPLLLISLVLLVNLWFIYRFSGNYFWYDDLIVAFYEVEGLLNAKGFWASFKILTAPYADHRSMLSRVFFYVISAFNGYEIDFQKIMLVGNLFIIPSFFIFLKVWKRNTWNMVFLVPVAFFLFNLQFFEAQLFANGVYCYLAVIFFCIWLIYEAAFHGRLLLMSLICICGLLTFGTMLFGMGASVILLVIQRDYKKVLYWLLICAVILFVYFFNLKNAYSSTSSISEIQILKGLKLFFFHLMSPFSFEGLVPEKGLMLVSVAVVGFVCWSLLPEFRKIIKRERVEPTLVFILGLLLFASLSAGAISMLRGAKEPYAIYFSRYRFAPIIFVVASYLLFVYRYGARFNKGRWAVVAASFVFFYLPSQFIYFERAKELYFNATAVSWQFDQKRNLKASTYDPFDFSQEKNFTYAPHSEMDAFFSETILESGKGEISKSLTFENFEENEQDYFVVIKQNSPAFRTFRDGNYFLLKGREDDFYWLGIHSRVNDLRSFLKTGRFFDGNGEVYINKSFYPKEDFQVFYLEKRGESGNIFLMKNSISF